MKLEQQVCSLELAKKLEKLGVKQESLFFWSQRPDLHKDTNPIAWSVEFRSMVTSAGGKDVEWHSAFTVAELGEMLPAGALGAWLMTSKNVLTGTWNCAYGVQKTIFDETEADARAKMLIYLLENNLLSNEK